MYDLLMALWDKGYGRPAFMRGRGLQSLRNRDGYSTLVLAAVSREVDAAVFMHMPICES